MSRSAAIRYDARVDRRLRPLSFLGLTLRNLYRQPLRTVLTVLGVALGVVAMVAFTAIVRGMWHATQTSIVSGGTDLIVFQAGVAGDIFSVLDEQKIRAKLAADPDVAETAAVMTHLLPVEGKPFFLVFGVHPEEFSSRERKIIEGRTMERDDELVIGTLARRALNKSAGDALSLGGRSFRIVGVFETEVVFFNGAIVLKLPALQQITRREGLVTAFQVKLRPGADPRLVAGRLERTHRELAAITGADTYHKVDDGLALADGVLWSVSLLAMIVGSAIVMNTMWMSVHERTRELGVLRAVGWSRRRIIAMILAESVGVGALACLVGSPLGYWAAEFVSSLSVASRYLRPVLDATPVILAFATCVGLSICGGLLPAWRAARISPAEALRYE